MQLVRGLHNLHKATNGCVATIGNFDGVHLGHQSVLGELSEKAGEMGLPAVVVTFDPHPAEFFTHAESPARLTRFREKIKALRRLAVDEVVVLHFNRQLAELSAADFIQQVLVDALGVKHLVVGDDFHFGKGRAGNFHTLVNAGKQFDFQVVNMHSFRIAGERVSSTRIRAALADGNLALAEQLLGRTYRMCGRVAHGDKMGRTIQFPTANIHLHRKVTPIEGVFAVQMLGIEGEPVNGVANVGTRPTRDGTRSLLEVHLLDFNMEIYGKAVMVDFLHKIRNELRFDSFEKLKEQIELDVVAAKDFFSKNS